MIDLTGKLSATDAEHNRRLIDDACERAARRGGGEVVLPAGTWPYPYPLPMPEGVHLRGAASGKTILARHEREPEDYPED